MSRRGKTVIIFPDGHSWEIGMLRAALIVMIGNYKFKHDGPKNGSHQVIWEWDQATLRFHVDSAQAGQADITVIDGNSKLIEIITEWRNSDTVKMPEPGRRYE